MTPTPEQVTTGWIPFPDRETWDRAVNAGRVWQWWSARFGMGACDSRAFAWWRDHDAVADNRFFRPINPHTGDWWPMETTEGETPCKS